MDSHQLLANLKQIHQQILLLLSNDYVFDPSSPNELNQIASSTELNNPENQSIYTSNLLNEISTSSNSANSETTISSLLSNDDPLNALLDHSLLQNIELGKADTISTPQSFSLSEAILDDLFEENNE